MLACRMGRLRAGGAGGGTVVEIRLLGPVEVWDAGVRRACMATVQQRAVLAALAVDAGRPVLLATLIDRVWDEAPPAGVRPAVYAHITRLRQTLDSDDSTGRGAVGVVRRGGGYVLDIEPDQVDLHRFRRLTAAARGQGCSDEQRVGLLAEALALWRGPPLADLPSQWAARLRDSWGQQRLDTVVSWAQALLRLDRPDEVTGTVRDLLTEHPLAEPLTAVLMQALAADGRDAEALACYAATRARLIEELGAEPGTDLRALHQTILRGDHPRRAQPPPPPPIAARPVPAQLPADVHAFTGRNDELAVLDRLLTAGDEHGSATAAGCAPVVISAISGTPGVGKTALAIHAAHRVCGRFPDGQLYINLRGYDPDQPMPPADALARLLTALGVPGPDIPLDLDDRAARYRTELTGRRILIVLDNAGTVEQVRPLLPGTPSTAVIVTSRDALAGLVAIHGARRLDLDLLPPADAISVLRTLIGDRVNAEPDAAAALAAHSAHLPLALRVAAELAISRPHASLTELAADLADRQQRLDLLDAAGDTRAAVRTVFFWSYQHLPADTARTFRLLGLHPGPDHDPYAAAALAAMSVGQAQRTLDQLARAHLIHPTGPGRYTMHDLLRAYATELTHTEDTDDERNTALTRLLDHYLATAAAAADVLYPAAEHKPPLPPVTTPGPLVADSGAALVWLDAERATLIAAIAHATAEGPASHAIGLAIALEGYLHLGGHSIQALTVHRHACEAAVRAGDPASEANALTNLAVAYGTLGQFATAAEHLPKAARLHREAGNRAGEAEVFCHLGTLHAQQGSYGPAIRRYEQALEMFRQAGNQRGESLVLRNLSVLHIILGRYQAAINGGYQALKLYRQSGFRGGEATVLTILGDAYLKQGRHAPAIECHQRALLLSQETGNRRSQAEALSGLGDAYAHQGRHARAAGYYEQARDLHRQTGNWEGYADAMIGIAATTRAIGQPRDGVHQYAAALAIATDKGFRYQQARAHNGLAHAYHELGDNLQARTHWQHALTIHADLGTPGANKIQSQLDTLGTPATTGTDTSTAAPSRPPSSASNRLHKRPKPADQTEPDPAKGPDGD